MPWRLWRQSLATEEESGACDLGSDEADQSAAVAVLHTLHEDYDVTKQSVEVWKTDFGPYVVASTQSEAKSILLPPCVPRQSTVHRQSEHPCAVHVITKVMRSTEQTVQPGGDNILRQREHSLLPEFTSPELDKDPKTAVAGVDPQWVWRGRETMHPFWAVRRMTAKQMSVAQDKFANDTQQCPTSKWRPRFNCSLETQTLSCVCIAIVGTQALNRTRILEVPFLANTVMVENGEELILQIGEKEKKANPKRTWQVAMKEDQKNDSKLKLKQAKEKKSTE